jgi:hypothetical protein
LYRTKTTDFYERVENEKHKLQGRFGGSLYRERGLDDVVRVEAIPDHPDKWRRPGCIRSGRTTNEGSFRR